MDDRLPQPTPNPHEESPNWETLSIFNVAKDALKAIESLDDDALGHEQMPAHDHIIRWPLRDELASNLRWSIEHHFQECGHESRYAKWGTDGTQWCTICTLEDAVNRNKFQVELERDKYNSLIDRLVALAHKYRVDFAAFEDFSEDEKEIYMLISEELEQMIEDLAEEK